MTIKASITHHAVRPICTVNHGFAIIMGANHFCCSGWHICAMLIHAVCRIHFRKPGLLLHHHVVRHLPNWRAVHQCSSRRVCFGKADRGLLYPAFRLHSLHGVSRFRKILRRGGERQTCRRGKDAYCKYGLAVKFSRRIHDLYLHWYSLGYVQASVPGNYLLRGPCRKVFPEASWRLKWRSEGGSQGET